MAGRCPLVGGQETAYPVKALEQSYRKGTLQVMEVPRPRAGRGRVVVRTAASLASVGTEKAMVELARKSLLGKALARPDLVKQVLDKARTEGIAEAWRQAMGRLETPILLGYSSAGTVVDLGPGAGGFKVGDRVACAGAGYAGHAEFTSVPANLCVPVPDTVTFEEAAFVALGGIALEAVRMARVGLGDRVAVIGLGLLGQIAVQLLHAAGCHVFGVDVEPGKADMASRHGAEATAIATDGTPAVDAVLAWSGGHGADAVIIMAAAHSNGPLEQAAAMCRERGRIVATGMVGLQVPRKPFYDKELELVVSRAWGPGLYDQRYAQGGVDYPLAYARWTAGRNMEEFLAQLARGAVSVRHLITHRFPIERAVEAYEMVLEGQQPCIGVLLTYPDAAIQADGTVASPFTVWLKPQARPAGSPDGRVGVGLIGAGQFASGTLLPALRGLKGLRLRGVATSTGISGRHAGARHGFEYCTSDYRELLADPAIGLVLVLTRHGSHSALAAEALRAGKHVFVEKPLALDVAQLRQVVGAYQEALARAEAEGRTPPVLMVGLNRRFSPFVRWLRERLERLSGPLSLSLVVNAGPLPADSWANDPEDGGGRIIGEVCHFVDLAQYLAGSPVARAYAQRVAGGAVAGDDSVSATLALADGSVASITYAARGSKRYPRERVQVFGAGAVGAIENFKEAVFVQGGRGQRIRSWLSVDRGYRGEMEALLAAVSGHAPTPVSLDDYLNTTLTTFALERSLKSGRPEDIGPSGPFLIEETES